MYRLISLISITGIICKCLFAGIPDNIPSSRVVDWTEAGLIGGAKPDLTGATTINVSSSTHLLQILDTLSGTCETILQLGASTYSLDTTLVLKSNTILRGVNSNLTKLLFNVSDSCVCIKIAGATGDTVSISNSTLPKGTTSITVDDPTVLAGAEYIDVFSNNGTYDFSNPNQSEVNPEHMIGQVVGIEDISGYTITLRNGLRRSYETDSGGGSVWEPSAQVVYPIMNVGIEDLYIGPQSDGNGEYVKNDQNITFYSAVNCWIEGINSFKPERHHVSISKSSCIYIKRSNFEEAFEFGGGEGYGVTIGNHSTNCIVENNSFRLLRHAMILGSGANGNIIAYNYSRQNVATLEYNGTVYFEAVSGIPIADICLHGRLPHANLIEGNDCMFIGVDEYWGPVGPHNTFFNNRSSHGFGLIISSNSSGQNIIHNTIDIDPWDCTSYIQGFDSSVTKPSNSASFILAFATVVYVVSELIELYPLVLEELTDYADDLIEDFCSNWYQVTYNWGSFFEVTGYDGEASLPGLYLLAADTYSASNWFNEEGGTTFDPYGSNSDANGNSFYLANGRPNWYPQVQWPFDAHPDSGKQIPADRGIDITDYFHIVKMSTMSEANQDLAGLLAYTEPNDGNRFMSVISGDHVLVTKGLQTAEVEAYSQILSIETHYCWDDDQTKWKMRETNYAIGTDPSEFFSRYHPTIPVTLAMIPGTNIKPYFADPWREVGNSQPGSYYTTYPDTVQVFENQNLFFAPNWPVYRVKLEGSHYDPTTEQLYVPDGFDEVDNSSLKVSHEGDGIYKVVFKTSGAVLTPRAPRALATGETAVLNSFTQIPPGSVIRMPEGSKITSVDTTGWTGLPSSPITFRGINGNSWDGFICSNNMGLHNLILMDAITAFKMESSSALLALENVVIDSCTVGIENQGLYLDLENTKITNTTTAIVAGDYTGATADKKFDLNRVIFRDNIRIISQEIDTELDADHFVYVLTNNVFDGSSDSDFEIYCDRPVIKNNIFLNCDIELTADVTSDVRKNVLYNSTISGGLGHLNIIGDPLFINGADGDYRISSSSPCVDSGDTLVAGNDPDGTLPDIGALYCPQTTISTAMTISSDTEWYGIYTVDANVSVSSGVTLSITPGSLLKFPDLVSGYVYFDVYGNLVADGSSEAPITFTSYDAAPHYRDWYGIRIFSSSNDNITIIDNCIIEYARYGIYLDGMSPDVTNTISRFNDYGIYTKNNAPDIGSNQFLNNQYGIYNYLSSAVYTNNVVSGSYVRGSYFSGTSTPYLYNNTIEQNTGYGAYLYNHADVQFGHSGANDPGYNEIVDNSSYGLYSHYYSEAFLGTTDAYNQQVAGSNSIHDNGTNNLRVVNNSDAEARWTWWDGESAFYKDATSNYDVADSLTSEPNSALLGSSLAKGSEYEGYADCADYDFFDPDTSSECALWYWAHDLRVTEQLPVALWAWELYVSKFPGAENAPKALVKIANFTPEEDRQDLIGYLGGVMETSAYSDILRVKALELLIGINIKTGAFADAYTCALALLDQSLCEDQEKIALFSLIDLSQIEGLGKSSLAAGYLGRLKATYPNDELTLMAAEIMGEEVDWSQMSAGTPEPQEEVVALPAKFELYQAYPNPFNPITTIRYDLSEDVQVQLKIFDITGREVTTLVSRDQVAGVYEAQWNGLGSNGNSLPSGLYLYRLQAGSFVANEKMLLLK